MPMDVDRVAEAMMDNMQIEFGVIYTAPQRANAKKVWKAFAKAMIDEIKVNGTLQVDAADFEVSAGGLRTNNTIPYDPVYGSTSVTTKAVTGKIS